MTARSCSAQEEGRPARQANCAASLNGSPVSPGSQSEAVSLASYAQAQLPSAQSSATWAPEILQTPWRLSPERHFGIQQLEWNWAPHMSIPLIQQASASIHVADIFTKSPHNFMKLNKFLSGPNSTLFVIRFSPDCYLKVGGKISGEGSPSIACREWNYGHIPECYKIYIMKELLVSQLFRCFSLWLSHNLQENLTDPKTWVNSVPPDNEGLLSR